MKVTKDGAEFEAFQASSTEAKPAWLTKAEKAGDVYTDEHDGQTYIKGELNPKTNETGRSFVAPTDWIVKAKNGSMVPHDDRYFREAFSPAEE